ncbi:hypothetical protein GC102_26365 [Paenibacillus sp. LMG 31460]|uniref:Tetracyclin repressor-like C-terminal domain-containing protein n=1 Tax=Paenibacillus germinis TaxID=2654979 RepID=A0ABX1Z8R0_9BACL|nr:TetR family transcriptional regulator C-terminal domain-containing protein [Paenibacillus germinis]NOU89249.1 hypothetical protein [Paenibacillus germinis]
MGGPLSSELADTDSAARTQLADGFMQWEFAFCIGLRAMYERVELRTDANPDNLTLTLLTALQGGLLLTQCRKETSPLEAVLDAMLAYIQSFVIRSAARLMLRIYHNPHDVPNLLNNDRK